MDLPVISPPIKIATKANSGNIFVSISGVEKMRYAPAVDATTKPNVKFFMDPLLSPKFSLKFKTFQCSMGKIACQVVEF